MPRIVWYALYALMFIVVTRGMYSFRQSAIDTYGSNQAKSDWDSWRVKAADEADAEGPVIRKPRESDEPPALVLMRDHFMACLGFALLLSSILFLTLAVMFEGAIARAPRPRT